MAKQKDKIMFSVGVITYNSVSTVVETLDSIAAQSYADLELVISDDGSCDNSIALGEEWLKTHEGRFIRTKIITVEHNTGTSANCNRLARELKGDYYMIIAGDDLLQPNGVELILDYIQKHPDMTVLFTRHKCFGATEQDYRHIDSSFNYNFFSWTPEQQLHQLIFDRNCVPAVGVIFNRAKMLELGIEFDERVPLMEDHPMWINLLQKGVRFDYLDQPVTAYRVSGGVSTGMLSPAYYETCRRFMMLYQYPEWAKKDPQEAIERLIAEEMHIYRAMYDLDRTYKSRTNSHAYRLGKLLLKPFKWLLKKK